MLQSERSFDYVKINLASPSRIRSWGERVLPNGETIGEVVKPETINYKIEIISCNIFINRVFELQFIFI